MQLYPWSTNDFELADMFEFYELKKIKTTKTTSGIFDVNNKHSNNKV